MGKQLIMVMTLLMSFVLCSCGGAEGAEEEPEVPDYTSAVVSYLGPEGTYTQEACGVFFSGQGQYIPYTTVQEAVDALAEGRSDYAVIPQENAIGGPVTEYVELLIGEERVNVVGEVDLLIGQNLLGLPGTKLQDIKKVYSHAQGIAQGKEWLDENLPGAELVVVSSTAEGAKRVAEEKDPACAAIASAACVDVYGLQMLEANIQQNDNNRTRFYVLSAGKPLTAANDRMAMIASGKAEELPSLMAGLEKQGMTLVTIHVRPLKTELGEYIYFVECAGGSYEGYQELVKDSSFEFRFLGCFPLR